MLDPLSRIMQLLPVACLCLLSCSAVADGNEVTRVVVKEDGDALLPCSLSTEQNIQSELFDWKKDGRNVFLYDAADEYNSGRSGQDVQFKGRVFHFQDQLKHGNASIIIRNTRVEDGGDYTCAFPRLQGHVFHIKLVVGAAPKPSVKILDETKDWSLLQCEVEGASPKPLLQWKDSAGNILPAKEPQFTERGGSYDVILQTTVTKTDHYHCVVTQEEISHQTEAETYVHISGAAPKPSIKTLDETKDWSLLQCEVEGASPKPLLQWKDSAGNILPAKEPQFTERGGSYDVILQTTVTKTDHYHCVVTQEEISHQTEAETYVHISDSTGLVVAAVVGPFLGLGVGVGVLLAVLYTKGCITVNPNKGSQAERDPL
ncbi:V-set domain-containing T-cell activation inhibitor 1-like [Pempheris klunzingeri]|uniref:V-set domain-containing T-cell activation inhibitor 1-like n=1 Tax=Pempheris klunzingeri TaxID=3127111 RepID=UPI00397FD68E